MEKKHILLIVAITVLAIFAVVGYAKTPLAGAAAVASREGVQEVKLSYQNYQYVLEPSTLKVGVPVKMEVDLSTVYGCMRDIRIAAFGVSKLVREGDNIISFTPSKTGTFNIACSMNMGRGTFTVTDSAGSTTGFVEQAPAASSCGLSGGCGCGAV